MLFNLMSSADITAGRFQIIIFLQYSPTSPQYSPDDDEDQPGPSTKKKPKKD